MDAGSTQSVMSAIAPAKATRRDWIGLAVIALPCMLYSMDLTVLNLAVPALSAQLNPSSSQLLWIVDIYGFMVAGFLITMGTLGDRIGRRRLLLIGAAAFGVASVLAAFANSAPMLIAMRALLGIAGATLAPSTLSLIRNMFHDSAERTFAIGIWISSYSIGGVIGPLVGGMLLEYFWWGSVFLVAVPVMVLLLLLGPLLLPEFRDPNAGRIDLLSAALSLVAVLSVIYGLKHLAEHGAGWPGFLSVAVGVGFATVFVRRQARLTYPLIDVALFRLPTFNVALLTYAFGCFTMFGSYIFIMQYLQLVLGLSPLQAGLWTVPWCLAFVAGSMVTPRLVERMNPTRTMSWGLAAAALGFGLLVFIEGRAALAAIVAGTVIMSLGLAPLFTLANERIVGSAPPERAGAASAISETCAELSGALGIAIFGSIGIALYRGALSQAMPAGVSSEAAHSALATLGGALSAAQQLSEPARAQLLQAARAAFVDGMQFTVIACALIMAGTAVLVTHMLRDSAARAMERAAN
jgi:MFS transporter, DHA2 family, multidrug resistance protein